MKNFEELTDGDLLLETEYHTQERFPTMKLYHILSVECNGDKDENGIEIVKITVKEKKEPFILPIHESQTTTIKGERKIEISSITYDLGDLGDLKLEIRKSNPEERRRKLRQSIRGNKENGTQPKKTEENELEDFLKDFDDWNEDI